VEDEDEPAEEVTGRQELYLVLQSPQVPSKLSGLMYLLSVPRNSYKDSCKPDRTVESGHSYSNILLSYTSLFVLADCKLVNSLKDLTLFKLYKTLYRFKLDTGKTRDIVDLA
jgi:hypothetical protein